MRIKKTYSYYFVYLTKNLVNNKCYVGWHATNNLNDGYLGSGIALSRAIKKYGKNNFITGIIEMCKKTNILQKEKYWIKEKNTLVPNGYNLTGGGDGGNTYTLLSEKDKEKFRKKCSEGNKGKKVSKETCKKISDSNKGKSRNKGILKTEEHKQKLKEAWKKRRIEKPTLIETKEKISKSQKGSKRSKESVKKMSLTWLGRNHTEESKEKNRKSHLGKRHSKETIEKISKKYECPYCKKMVNKGNLNRWHNENCKLFLKSF